VDAIIHVGAHALASLLLALLLEARVLPALSRRDHCHASDLMFTSFVIFIALGCLRVMWR